MLDGCEVSISHPLLMEDHSGELKDKIVSYCTSKGGILSKNEHFLIWRNGSVKVIQNKGPFNKYFGSYTRE